MLETSHHCNVKNCLKGIWYFDDERINDKLSLDNTISATVVIALSSDIYVTMY